MQAMARHKRSHEKFLKLANRIAVADPPCMSSAEDWESQNGWVDELALPSEPDSALPSLPDGACMLYHSAHVLSEPLPHQSQDSGLGRNNTTVASCSDARKPAP